jgi:predicted enzyme related to lactoylglutathione lyase
MNEKTASPVRQLRLVVEADDFEEAVTFYRDVLGLPEQTAFQGEGEARVVILEAGRATLELANPAHKAMIDQTEAGGAVSPRIKVAFEVDDTRKITAALVAAGGRLVADPTLTPWQSLNSRIDAPARLQLTLFEEVESLDERSLREGFGTNAGRGD